MATADLILIDDDELVRLTWSIWAKDHNRVLLTFASLQEFIKVQENTERTIPIYIDLNLKWGQSGLAGAGQLNHLGFKEIYITTGSSLNRDQLPPWIGGVIDKHPPEL